jgi:phosphoribosylformylglycinamidine cyclo-ligase
VKCRRLVEKMSSKYAEVGVDVKKEGTEVFKPALKSLFPRAFCPITRDPNLPKYGMVLHTDGAGSKPLQNYLHWCETDESRWFQGIAYDVIAMNIDDVMCVGAAPLGFVDYVAVNRSRVPKEELLAALNIGFKECFSMLEKNEIKISFLGGETADLPDQLRTLDVSGTISARVELYKVISGESIGQGDVIIGLRSGGRTKYERQENSGIMCNGITLARHCLMKNEYERKYPELRDPDAKGYYGRFAFDDHLDELDMAVGEAILSPTRIFAPVIAKILEKHGKQVTGLVHDTGGGQTKCLGLGKNIHYIKDDLIGPDPIFRLIQREAKVSWMEMFQDFNMGIGFEIIARKKCVEKILAIAERFGIGAKVIGRCEKSDGKNRLTIKSEFGKFEYR